MARMTIQQVEYYKLYDAGYTQQQIADRFGVNKSTVCRVLQRARCTYRCPFGTTCDSCILPECGIKDEYAFMLNATIDGTHIKRKYNKLRTKE